MGTTTSYVLQIMDLPGSRPMHNALSPVIELVTYFIKGIFVKEIIYHYLQGY